MSNISTSDIRERAAALAEWEQGLRAKMQEGGASTWVFGDKVRESLADVNALLAENAELRAKLDARRDGGSLLSAIVGHLRADGFTVFEPGVTSHEEVVGALEEKSSQRPRVEVDVQEEGEYGEYARVKVLVNGSVVATGSIGGEPEDNTIGRDYAWVPGALEAVARACGAEVGLGPAAPGAPKQSPTNDCPNCGKPLRADGTCGSTYADCTKVGRTGLGEVADFPAGVRLRLVNGALWDGRYVVTTGKKSNHGELPCVNVYSRDVVLPDAKDYAGRVYVVNPNEHEWLPDPRTTFEVGQTVRITDGRWAGRQANIVGAKLDDRWPARLLGKAVEVTGAIDCPSSLLLIDPKDPDEKPPTVNGDGSRPDSPPLNGSVAPKRNEPPKPADQWHPDETYIAEKTEEIAREVALKVPGFTLTTDALRAMVTSFKSEMMAKNNMQARWGVTFKGWAVNRLKATAAQTTIPGA